MSPPETDGWSSYQLLVMETLKSQTEQLKEIRKEHSDDMEALRKEFSAIHEDLAVHKMKAGMWGAIAGAIPGLVLTLYTLFHRKQ